MDKTFPLGLGTEGLERMILKACLRIVGGFLAAEGIGKDTLRLAIDSPIRLNEAQELGIPRLFLKDIQDYGPWGAFKRWSIGKNWDSLTKLRVLLFAIRVTLDVIDLSRDPIIRLILESLDRACERFEINSTTPELVDLLEAGFISYGDAKAIWEKANLPLGLALECYFAESQDLSEVLEQILAVYAPEKFKDKVFIVHALAFLACEFFEYFSLRRFIAGVGRAQSNNITE